MDLGQRAGVALDNARLLRDAAQANAAKTEFLRTVSHELRQPLNAIGGLLDLWELGLRGTLSTQQQDDLGRIKRNRHRLLSLIEDLLSFARLEAGKLDVGRVPTPLGPVLEDLAATVSHELDATGIEYRCAPCGPSVAVLGDADRLHQVLVNLVTNAIRATPAGGSVEVRCEPTPDVVEIHVRDTGTGIPADKLEVIFAPFVQLGRALSQPRDGAGLGLAISRSLTEAMGGTLRAESVVGQGSTFTVTLPASGRADGGKSA